MDRRLKIILPVRKFKSPAHSHENQILQKKIHSDYNYNIYFSRMVVSANGKDYHSVDIQLQNVIFPKERLENTPSMEEGLDEETEYELRNMGAELIQKAGIYLRLPQVAIATAQVIFQVKDFHINRDSN